MNKNNLFLITVAVIMVFSGYFFYQSQFKQKTSVNPGFEAIPSPVTNQAPGEIELLLNEQNDSGQSGKVFFIDIDGKATVRFDIFGGVPVSTAPANIREGTCVSLGAVKYPLVSLFDGKSTTTLDIPLAELKTQLPLAVNVYKSAETLEVNVLCADIVLP